MKVREKEPLIGGGSGGHCKKVEAVQERGTRGGGAVKGRGEVEDMKGNVTSINGGRRSGNGVGGGKGGGRKSRSKSRDSETWSLLTTGSEGLETAGVCLELVIPYVYMYVYGHRCVFRTRDIICIYVCIWT